MNHGMRETGTLEPALLRQLKGMMPKHDAAEQEKFLRHLTGFLNALQEWVKEEQALMIR